MSWTNNESGYVVYLLPAAIGCLTIFLARRWAYSQVTCGSSTAISRRRKIIKDPLIKRPLQPAPAKMIIPPPKKTNGSAKKSSFPNLEEDVTKKQNRRIPQGHSNCESKVCPDAASPKHIPFPQIPHDSDLFFEIMTFIYILVATNLQFLNLYRTSWWKPDSNYTLPVHYHLIDYDLVSFIIIILSRRLVFCIVSLIVQSIITPKLTPHARNIARILVSSIILATLSWYLYFIAHRHSLLKIFYLCYPAIIYLILFGVKLNPFVEISNTDFPLLHSCSTCPGQVRIEVETIRQDFNLRVKKILFNSVVEAYYSSFVPLCFAQSFVYYDAQRTAQQIAFVWGGLVCRFGFHMLSSHVYDVAHQASLHLGVWRKDDYASSRDVPVWCESVRWPLGSRCVMNDSVYECLTPGASAAPHCNSHRKFYNLFKNPSTLMGALLCVQLALIVVQICLLFSSSPWHYYLAIFLLLFMNYYTLFKIVRDYLVAWKIYRAENFIQDKANSIAGTCT